VPSFGVGSVVGSTVRNRSMVCPEPNTSGSESTVDSAVPSTSFTNSTPPFGFPFASWAVATSFR
jgi:hypothetical protein